MSLFSSKPSNRRRRTFSKSQSKSREINTPATSPKKKTARGKSYGLGDQVFQLNAQIGALETFLAKKNEAEVSRMKMKCENILPPPEKGARRTRSREVLSHAERRRYHSERSKNGLHFLTLFCLACGIVWWLVFSGV
jgi:hypothetical protein